MKINYLILVTFLFSSCSGSKKIVEEVMEESVGVKYDILENGKAIEVDKLKNIYVLTKENKVVNYGGNKQKKYEYANKKIGAISSIDVRDPLRVLLFIDDFDQIMVLDNSLSEISQVNLQENGFTDVSAVAKSNDTNIWLYDRANRQVVKVDEKGTIVSKSSNMEDFGITNLNPIKMVESGNILVIADAQQGFFIFDNFGQFIKKFTVANIVDFQFDGRLIVFYDGKGIKAYNTKFPNSIMMGYPAELRGQGVKNVYFTMDKWYGLFQEGIKIVERIEN